jgi:hypothetical protein
MEVVAQVVVELGVAAEVEVELWQRPERREEATEFWW